MIEYIDQRKLEKARLLQRECVENNIPSPPVVSFEIMVMSNEEKIKHIVSKSNSYVRNAYNIISQTVALTASNVNLNSYNDGYICFKRKQGTLQLDLSQYVLPYRFIQLGTGTTPDVLNDFDIENDITNSFRSTPVSQYSYFTPANRIMVTELSRVFVNNGVTDLTITESCLFASSSISMPDTSTFLMIRDVFSPVLVASGNSITFTYKTEVVYP